MFNPHITRIAAELAALYNDEPHLHRIDPGALAAIEDAGGTYNFETGAVELPPVHCPVLVVSVGVLDSATGIVHWRNAKGT